MSVRSMVIDEKTKEIRLVLSLDPPKPSKSGLTQVIGSTHGNVTLGDVQHNGEPVVVGCNVFVRA